MYQSSREETKELSRLLEQTIVPPNTRDQNQSTLEAAVLWNAPEFFAKILSLAEPMGYECTKEEFNAFHKQYELENAIEIDSEGLFEKHWLRNVLGFVHIAGVVSSVCWSFDKIKEHKNETQFLVDFYLADTEKNKKITKPLLEFAMDAFDQKNGITLDREFIYTKGGWLSEKDGKIELCSMDSYYTPYLKYWNEFLFLNAFKLFKGTTFNEKGAFVEKVSFEETHELHSRIYPKTPPIVQFMEQNTVHLNKSGYRIDFYKTNPGYWFELSDKILSRYWLFLLDDTRYANDQDRVLTLISQTSYRYNFGDILKHSTEDAKTRFIDAALALLLQDEDTLAVADEFYKIELDEEMSSYAIHTLANTNGTYSHLAPDFTNHFNLLQSLKVRDRLAHKSFLVGQKSRTAIWFLTRLVVQYDHEFEKTDDNSTAHFPRVFKLLQSSIKRPVLLWYITHSIGTYRSAIIPDLLLNKAFVSMSFQVIDSLSLRDEAPRENIRLEIWSKVTDIALHTIRTIDDAEQKATIIFQIFRQLNSLKYEEDRSRKYSDTIWRTRLDEKEKQILTMLENATTHHPKANVVREYIIPTVFNELSTLFSEMSIPDVYRNGTVTFPMAQWDGMVWLMKCSTLWKYQAQFAKTPKDAQVRGLVDQFMSPYTELIEGMKVKKLDWQYGKEKDSLPIWSQKNKELDFIEWVYPIYLLNAQNRLSRFLNVRIDFEKAQNKYHEKNRLRAKKLRTHIGVLVTIMKKLMGSAIPYGFSRDDSKKIQSAIEASIIDYITQHRLDDPKSGQVDLFDHTHSLGIEKQGDPLLPRVMEISNLFKNRDALVESILHSGDVTKILVAAEEITSEGLKKQLIKGIREADLKAFLESRSWAPEISQTLSLIRQYPELKEHIEQVLKYWEENVKHRDQEHAHQVFQTKLLLAYYNNSMEELNEVELPKRNVSSSELNAWGYKEFYRALILGKDEPEKAIDIYSNLIGSHPQYPVFAMNRMSSRIKLATTSGDQEHYRSALEEWKIYYDEHKTDVNLSSENLGPVFAANKLHILKELNEHSSLDEEYNKLEHYHQMSPNILTAKIGSLVERRFNSEARILLQEARQFHAFTGNNGLITELAGKIDGETEIEKMQNQYNRIFGNEPQTLIQVFPPKLNGRKEIDEFLTKEFAEAASKMLVKIKSVSKIRLENKYNDLIQLALESRIKSWGWQVVDQTRAGSSASGKDLGEIDLEVKDSNSRHLITCEAFILRDKARVQSHLQKLIGHYTPNRRSLLVLVYCLGTHKEFEKEWKKYSSKTVAQVDYPEGYSMVGTALTDLTDDYGFTRRGIRIGKADLESGTSLFHIFVNIDYKISFWKKLIS